MLRSLIKRLSPSLYERIREESLQWMMQCPRCHHETSVWENGGIRYKASGTVFRLGRCSACGHIGMQRVHRTS